VRRSKLILLRRRDVPLSEKGSVQQVSVQQVSIQQITTLAPEVAPPW
jgi:hypothetical protein